MEPNTIIISHTSNIADLQPEWEELEHAGVCSPYQQYAWVKNFLDNITPKSPEHYYFVTLHDQNQLVAILPFVQRTQLSCRILSWVGNEHFNYYGALYDQAFLKQLSPTNFHLLWERIKKSLPSFDLLSLKNQLSSAENALNPFEWLNATPSANLSHQLIYPHHDWGKLLISLRGKKTRKRMRNEESRLNREGELRWWEVTSAQEIEQYLPELFSQRENRLHALGIQIHEKTEEYTQLYSGLLISSLDNADRPTRMIIIKLDEHLLAAIVLFKWKNAYYPLINSITETRYRNWSPGEYLLRIMMTLGCEEKIEFVDYGLGEDGYKTAWCNHTTPLFDTLIAETNKGKLVSSAIHHQQQLKRKIKHSPKLWELYRRLRKWRGKISTQTETTTSS